MHSSFLDHITITAPSLTAGVEYVRRTLGIMPQVGGEHPSRRARCPRARPTSSIDYWRTGRFHASGRDSRIWQKGSAMRRQLDYAIASQRSST